jgi:hypothetical protein
MWKLGRHRIRVYWEEKSDDSEEEEEDTSRVAFEHEDAGDRVAFETKHEAHLMDKQTCVYLG